MITNEQKFVWVMKYKDIDSEQAPWLRWLSTDEPSKFMLQHAKENGFHWLKVIGKINSEQIDVII